MNSLNDTQFERVGLIFKRKQESWTLREEDLVYWWFYHDSGMETPSEDQLKYCAKRYIGYHYKWCKFLLQSFPTEMNVEFVRNTLRGGESFANVIKSVLGAAPFSQSHIDIADKYGSENTRKKVRRIMTRFYEI